MLGIEEVKKIGFGKAKKNGYSPEDVDAFIDEVVATLEQNQKDKVELIRKLDILAKRIEEYRKDEESVRGALINAEKLKEEAIKESKAKADDIIQEAQTKAKQIVYDANASVIEQKNNYLKLQADAVVLRESLLETYNNHIRMLEDLPTSSEISKKKTELDKSYPTGEKAEAPVKEKEEVVDISANDDKEKVENVAKENSDGKFDNLEFGEDYKSNK